MAVAEKGPERTRTGEPNRGDVEHRARIQELLDLAASFRCRAVETVLSQHQRVDGGRASAIG